jgi:hypothetical protein
VIATSQVGLVFAPPPPLIPPFVATAPQGRHSVRDDILANSGGPMSRTRKEAVRSSLLGKRQGDIVCPRRMKLGLDFGGKDPLEVMIAMLAAGGIASPEGLRGVVGRIPGPMLCGVDPQIKPLRVEESDPNLVLRQAFLLGLCTAVFFDPSRPVLWTRASLTRRLALFETAGFYA